jgi:hypothetical protein
MIASTELKAFESDLTQKIISSRMVNFDGDVDDFHFLLYFNSLGPGFGMKVSLG